MCMQRMCRVSGFRCNMPPMCIRQLMSFDTTTSAPVRTMFSTFVPPMASDVPGILTLNVPPKPQHSVMFAQFAVGQPANALQQPHRRLDHAQLAAAVAADVHRDLVRERRFRVGHAEHVVEELGQLEHPAADAHGARVRVGMAEKHPAHRRAGARGADDPAVRLEDVAKMLDHPPGLFPIARVERRLAAAGLLGRKDQRHAVPLQQPGRRLGDLGVELVDVAGDEQGHRLARPIGRIILPRGHAVRLLASWAWKEDDFGAGEYSSFYTPGGFL